MAQEICRFPYNCVNALIMNPVHQERESRKLLVVTKHIGTNQLLLPAVKLVCVSEWTTVQVITHLRALADINHIHTRLPTDIETP